MEIMQQTLNAVKSDALASLCDMMIILFLRYTELYN